MQRKLDEDSLFFWASTSQSSSSSLSLNRKKRALSSDVQESPDFHDPYSDLSLFLSDSIQKQMKEANLNSEGTLEIQEEILQKILPEFQKKFPQYRLGLSSFQKIWKKILFYREQMQEQSEALDKNGKINITFFIKENLRQFIRQKTSSFLSPYQYAFHVASKMSECIATLEGIRPKIDLLTHIVWASQKHLIQEKAIKSPYDEYDLLDKLITKTMLEITVQYPQISMQELELKTKDHLQTLQDLSNHFSCDKITCNVSAILAEKLFTTSHFYFSSKQTAAIKLFILKHSHLRKHTIAMRELPDFVRRLVALYTLASQLPKQLDPSLVEQAILAIYEKSQSRPDLPQSIYAFFSAELLLTGHLDQKQAINSMMQAYEQTNLLPILVGKNRDVLEILIWKFLGETEGFLEKLPYLTGYRIEQELAYGMIEDPSKSFSASVHETVYFFSAIKELTGHKTWKDLDKKIHIWALQSDMICRSIKLNLETPLAKLVESHFTQSRDCHAEVIHKICLEFLKLYPTLSLYMQTLYSRSWVIYKYLWFTKFSEESESSFDRFILWHARFFDSRYPLLEQLEELCQKCLPMTPFEPQYVGLLLARQKIDTEQDKRDAQILSNM